MDPNIRNILHTMQTIGVATLNAASHAATDGVSSLKETMGKYVNATNLGPICAPLAMMVKADGRATADEIETAVTNIHIIPGMERFSLQELRDKLKEKLDLYNGSADLAIVQRTLMEEAKKVPEAIQPIIVEIAIQIGAHGTFEASEVDVAKMLIKLYKLDEADFPRLASAAGGKDVTQASAWS